MLNEEKQAVVSIKESKAVEDSPARMRTLEEFAHQLAGSHSLARQLNTGTSLTNHINNQTRVLRAANDYFRSASAEELSISYAAEWTLDNFYIVQQTFLQIRENLPAKYYHQLPKLASGPLAGYPRIFDLARELIRFERAHLELERIIQFVKAYQEIAPLTMGEVWAVPIMLRIGIQEALAQALKSITKIKSPADDYSLPTFDFPAGLQADEVVANSFLSLRQLIVYEWKRFFERVNRVEQVLRRDPAGIYSKMDFETRDHYRKIVEKLALSNDCSEEEVAQKAIALAQGDVGRTNTVPVYTGINSSVWSMTAAKWKGLDAPRTTHVGYYLIDEGSKKLESWLNYKPAWPVRLARWLLAHPEPTFFTSITGFTVALLLALVVYALNFDVGGVQLFMIVLLGLIPALTVAVNLVNLIITRLVPPRVLPKMDFDAGLPSRCRTMVVVPTLLMNKEDIGSLMQQLEQHYLSNPDSRLSYALLTDFSDSSQEHAPEDKEIIDTARSRIEALNRRYHRNVGNPFYLFHRRRQWNPREGIWMGWERKRGKLSEFNRLLRGDQDTSFSIQVGDLSFLPGIRYVITLDADTTLPREAANRLVATLAHPLNRAQFDPSNGSVIAGYTLLQPRTETKPAVANRTWFTRFFSGDAGLDLYTRAVSDVYQDLFGEGIYVGKGIYDVDAFERSLAGRVPENALLSHDLFEGLHGRVALVTDVVLYEDYPLTFIAYIQRLHRWVRGDWQLLPWLFPWVPGSRGKKIRNNFTALDRWKIVDNLRRSLFSPTLLLFLIAAWLLLPGSSLVWTLAGIFVLGVPVLTSFFTWSMQRLRRPDKVAPVKPLRNDILRWVFALVFFPYEALIMLDAITLTLIRLFISRRGLLQWTTAAQTNLLFSQVDNISTLMKQFGGAAFVVFALALSVVVTRPSSLPVAAPLLLIWLFSPVISYLLSRPLKIKIPPLSAEQQAQLHTLARRTWLYFEQYVGPSDHWLPPDHFQESPRGQVAHRTSPTNIGLWLLSALSAFDLGYIGVLGLATRLRSTLDNLEKLERYRGHFLNWYDTQSLEPLPPRYVSTVDSGNLAACLIVLKQGCLMVAENNIPRWERWQGLLDTLAVLREIITELNKTTTREVITSLLEQLEEMRQQIKAVKDSPIDWISLITKLERHDRKELDRRILALIETEPQNLETHSLRGLRIYAQQVRNHLQKMMREIHLLVPWLPLLSQPPALFVSSQDNAPLQSLWRALLEALPHSLQLNEIPARCNLGMTRLEELESCLIQESGLEVEDEQLVEALKWCEDLSDRLESARLAANVLLIGYEEIGRRSESLYQEMDFKFLYSPQRHIFRIGYNLEARRLDANYYDLLASEARIGSLIAIAKRDVPMAHWLHLARPLTGLDGRRALLSWSGTMFEYLMPLLFMRNYENTLLIESYLTATEYQIAYGREKNVPWGISESGYYGFDAHQNYQYRAFGVPRLAYKRGLVEDLVISPYASLLALATHPQAVMQNIDHLSKFDMLGLYGLYEAIDFTPSHLPLGQEYAIVHSVMAHHQGMILLSLVNCLRNDIMVERFHRDPFVQSVDLLLQELIPQHAPLEYPHAEDSSAIRPERAPVTATSWRVPVETPMPQIHHLSNGRFSTLITNAGGGYSSWEGIDLTRWRADTTLDEYGLWFYIKDLDDGQLWSVGRQPISQQPATREVYFYPHLAEFHCQKNGISAMVEVVIPPQDDLEVRFITLVNQTDRPRILLLSSYAEVILVQQASDQRHPAFNKLFIESELIEQFNGLLFRRRPRSHTEEPLFLLHYLITDQDHVRTKAFESSRFHFLGRGQTPRSPAALCGRNWSLTGTTGATLDPIMVQSQEIELEPHGTAQVAFLTLPARSRQVALDLAEQYQSWPVVQRVIDQARSNAETEMRRLGLNSQNLQSIQQLFSVLVVPHQALRADSKTLFSNRLGQSSLWAYGISGDYPILLLRIHGEEDTPLLVEALRAHTFWRNRGIKIDLVILNKRETGYAQELIGQLHRIIHRMKSDNWLNRRGGIFLLRADQLTEASLCLLETAARAILDGNRGLLAQHLDGLTNVPSVLPSFSFPLTEGVDQEPTPLLPRPADLIYDNGMGGFSPDGKEYRIYLEPGQWTPAPWINVIANDHFGFLISESGGGYTWAINSGENRLTSWSNDPVSDRVGESLYLRDEESGKIWSPTPLPARAPAAYLIRHGAGYTIFEHNHQGLKHQLCTFVVKDAPVKVVRLRLENTWNHIRRLTVTYYAEWVLHIDHPSSQQYIIPEFDVERQALLARNPYNTEFGERVAFLTTDQKIHGLTADRQEFLGQLGDLSRPAALERIGLSGSVEAGVDPCAVLQVHVDLNPGEVAEVNFILGQGSDLHETIRLIKDYKVREKIESAFKVVTTFWDELLSAVVVKTPDTAMDLLLNRWLLYQTLSCRIWGRSAFYQSSGAYGFRDQLQDVQGVLFAAPQIAREHIVRSAAHQFDAGDVLHWWHPPSGRGVRKRITDNLLWLPFVTAQYITITGDDSILSEEAPFRIGPVLQPGEVERYDQYDTTPDKYCIYEHCLRALEKGRTSGPHGLPLMGGGDWNDGMNRVGIEGAGESVWLGWFLITTLERFADICDRRRDHEQANLYRQWAMEVKQAIEEHAWDGGWYRRAYYDDGTPLGSIQNRECRIDSIAQSWAVISRAGDPERTKKAMQSVRERLVRWKDRLILLFTPPFDQTTRDPGYIKGYLPGIRENGGQYTHAALWAIWAYAELGQGDLAGELFRLVNPIYRSDTPEKVDRYKVEPYVISADVYGMPPHIGRGGWTWYTGSSGWMYRLGIEALLGLRLEGQLLKIDPCIPGDWPGFELVYRYVDTSYHIYVENPQGINRGVKQVELDGKVVPEGSIHLEQDGGQHKIRVIMG